jgi:hypothetical protein
VGAVRTTGSTASIREAPPISEPYGGAEEITVMRRAVTAMVLGSSLLLTGCQQLRDLEGVPIKEPQRAEVYANLDEYANIVRICIDGVAFAMTTRDHDPLTRVPEWDSSFCGSARAPIK